ncbi:MAG: type IV secretion system DNA-binding domain-containing protein [Nitrososphaerota archaeon]|nr:type IV secretion system DNA-binding domain-containing protein [Nitrososphaerota archaeon]
MSQDELTLDDLKSHAYVIGGTRTGKTNLQLFLLNCLYLKRNQQKYPCSMIYIDPHGDASLRLATMLDDWEDLAILDPLYTTYSLNPLELPPLPQPDAPNYRRERAMAVQNQVEQLSVVMREMFSTSSDQAPRLMWLLKGALYYLYAGTDPANATSNSPEEQSDIGESESNLHKESGKIAFRPSTSSITFLDLYYLLNEMIRIDREELEVLLKNQLIPDEVVSRTMEAISKLEDNAFAAAMNRISNFVLPLASLTARTFCKRDSKLDFSQMLKPGRLTIFRIPKSNLPEDFCTMLTSAIVLRIYFMIQARARQQERSSELMDSEHSERTSVYVFIDEFQSISKLGILSTILSESAKFGLYLNIAHQNISQIPEDLFDAIIGNAGMVFAFRLGPDDARAVSKIMAPDEEKWAKAIVRLPNWLSVVRMNPRGDSALAKTLRFAVPKIKDPIHSQKEVIDYMLSEMEDNYGSGYELSSKDREPIYRAAMEEATISKGLPLLRPVEENILFVIDSRRLESKEMKFRTLAKIMLEQFGWNLSVTLGAVNSLIDRGYLHDMGIFYDPSLVGKLDDASLNEDEKDRSRETSYAITDYAKHNFLNRDVRGPRAGKNIHWNMLRYLIRYYRERKGSSCTIDYGESNKRWPDIIVYPMKTSFSRDRDGSVKEVHDPNHWDIKNRFAVEVETSPRKAQKQLLKNYYKSVYPPGQYSRVVFYVASAKHRKDVLDLLKGKPSTTFEVKQLYANVLGMKEEELEKQLELEEGDNNSSAEGQS